MIVKGKRKDLRDDVVGRRGSLLEHRLRLEVPGLLYQS
jgi:hypothetical protein